MRRRLAIHVEPYPVEEVTSRNVDGEVDPRAVGLDRAGVEAMWGTVQRLYRTGLHPAIGLCLRRNGKIVIERAIGHLRGNPPGATRDALRTPIRYDSLFNFFSASKAVTAMVIHLLDERRALHIDDAVVEYFPEFGRHGKEGVTIRQLLTHRAGIPAVRDVDVDAALLTDEKKLLEILCDARPLSVPGRRIAYHALTGGFVLGEVIRRVTGRDLRRVLREEILDPLGFATFDYGVPPARIGEVAHNAFTGLPAFPPQSWVLERVIGVGPRQATEISNDPRYLTGIVPSGNIIGTAEEACRFFQMLLQEGELGGVRVFDRRTIRRAVREQSYLEFDWFLGMPVRYAMGFMLGAEHFTPYGPHTSAAFGHLGFTNVIAWADPARSISACLMTSGKPFITPGQVAWLNVARTISQVCGA